MEGKISDWTKVGVVGVDAGLCWVGDPCYILHKKELPAQLGKNWGEFCDNIEDMKTDGALQFNYHKGHPGLGVCVSSGFGDGMYDVEVKYIDKSGWGRRVKEVRVVFIPDEELEDEEEISEDRCDQCGKETSILCDDCSSCDPCCDCEEDDDEEHDNE